MNVWTKREQNDVLSAKSPFVGTGTWWESISLKYEQWVTHWEHFLLKAGRWTDPRQRTAKQNSSAISEHSDCYSMFNKRDWKSICFPPGIILFETHLFVGRTLLRIPTEFDDGDKDSYGQSAQQDNKNATCKRLKIGRIHSMEKPRE